VPAHESTAVLTLHQLLRGRARGEDAGDSRVDARVQLQREQGVLCQRADKRFLADSCIQRFLDAHVCACSRVFTLFLTKKHEHTWTHRRLTPLEYAEFEGHKAAADFLRPWTKEY
jgi:hypothetical protein